MIKDLIFEVINEEQLDEKLIVYNNRKPYGQIVFLAGGAGSGKGFAGSHFIDSDIFRVRDVDEMKKQLQILNRLDKISIDQIIKKYGKNIKPKDLENIRTVQSQGFNLRNFNLKKPDHVSALHNLGKAMVLAYFSPLNVPKIDWMIFHKTFWQHVGNSKRKFFGLKRHIPKHFLLNWSINS